jgi:uncharacterized protein YjbI with pentapeptide repeats
MGRHEVTEPRAVLLFLVVLAACITGCSTDPLSDNCKKSSGGAWDCSGASLEAVDLSGKDLTGANFRGAQLRGANFERARLQKADFEDADLSFANLHNASMWGMSEKAFSGTNLYGATITSVEFGFDSDNPNMFDGLNLSHADLSRSRFVFVNLSGVDFSFATIDDVEFEHSNLAHANLQDVTGNNVRFIDVDLSETDFRNAYLRGSDFVNVDARGADFRWSDLVNGSFIGAKTHDVSDGREGILLSGANFSHADLRRASFGYAPDLSQAVLEGARGIYENWHGFVLIDLAESWEVVRQERLSYGRDTRGGSCSDLPCWPPGFDPEAAGVLLEKATPID